VARIKQRCSHDQLLAVLTSEPVGKYIEECLKLCLLMAATDPPIVIQASGWQHILGDGDTTGSGVVNVAAKESDLVHNDTKMGQQDKYVINSLIGETYVDNELGTGEFAIEKEVMSDVTPNSLAMRPKPVTSELTEDTNISTVAAMIERIPLNKAEYKEYTQRGDYVDYVVWPVMYLYDGGSQLAKGVAQGSNERYKAESECLWKWWK